MWYKDSYRRVFMDMHFSDDKEEEYLSKLDVEDFVNTLKEANVDNIVVKAKSHSGLNYWLSKIGEMHKGLKRRNLDYVGEMIKKSHENNLSVIVYLSQGYDNYAYENHPSWRIVDSKGETTRERLGRYGNVCPNNIEYRQYVKESLEELVSTYTFEGIFLDMPFWPATCYCASCRERFWKETGEYIPREENWDNPVWVAFANLRHEWIEEFAMESTKAVKGINPNVTIEHNFAAVGLNWHTANREELVDCCDYAGGDYYGGYLQQTFMCKYYNNVTPNKPFSYITSRCDPNLYAHTVSRCTEDLLIHAMNALVHNGAFSMCDAMNPNGTINKEVYVDSVKPVYEISQKYQDIVSGNLLTDVSIWYNTNMKANDNFIKSPFAIAEILKDNNVLYDVIGSRNLKDIKSQVLSINGVYTITDEEMNDIEEYLINGGNVFVTGKIAHEKLEELLGIEIQGESEYDFTYINPKEEALEMFKTFSESSPFPVSHKAYEATLKGEGKVLGTITYPYTKPNTKEFSAIHSNPPGINTHLPAIISKKVGKGTLLWVAMPLELTEAHYCRKATFNLINSLIETRKIKSNAPEFVEIINWEKYDKNYLAIINQQTKSPVYPISDLYITIPYKCENIKLLTSADNVELEYVGEETIIKLPKLEIFHILQL